MNTAPEMTETKYLNSILINLSLCSPLCRLYSQEGSLQVTGRMVTSSSRFAFYQRHLAKAKTTPLSK